MLLHQFAQFFAECDALLAGKMAFTFILKDPLAASWIYNPNAPEPDPQLEEVLYTRTPEEEQDLGLDDMNAPEDGIMTGSLSAAQKRAQSTDGGSIKATLSPEDQARIEQREKERQERLKAVTEEEDALKKAGETEKPAEERWHGTTANTQSLLANIPFLYYCFIIASYRIVLLSCKRKDSQSTPFIFVVKVIIRSRLGASSFLTPCPKT